MDERLEGLFRQSIGLARERYGLQLTDRAAHLLHLTIDSVEEEADERWPGEARGDPRPLQERAIERLPEILRWVARSQGTKLISLFLLLQITPRIIDAFCIWEKPPG
jgi:hypothetical protein